MKNALLIFLAVLAAYLLTAGGHLYSPDEEILFRTTRALATQASLAIDPIDPSGFGTRPPAHPRPDRREYGQYGVGQPLLAVPFYWVGAALAPRASDAVWQSLYPDWRPSAIPFTAAEIAPRWACSWFNIFLGALLAALLYLVCLEVTGHPRAAAGAALLYALGSLAWPHSRPFFSESCAAFFILLAWYALLRAGRGRLFPWCLLAGAAAGYAALVRLDSVLAYPALAVLLVLPILAAARRQGRSVLAAWGAFCLPALVCGVVLLGLNWLHFGGATKTGYADQPEGIVFSTPLAAGLYGFLFSAGKGLFFFSPALTLSFLGWRHLAGVPTPQSEQPAILFSVAAAIAVPLLVLSKWQNWPGGWCWGPRHIFIIHPFLALPIAAWLAARWGAAARVILAVFLLAGAAVQLVGCSQDFIAFHQRFFRSPGDNTAALVRYDPPDQAYWSQYYRVNFRNRPDEPFRELAQANPPRPILVAPRPIQDSLYIPQISVWNGYPQMWSEGGRDNFWLRLIDSRRAPRPEAARP